MSTVLPPAAALPLLVAPPLLLLLLLLLQPTAAKAIAVKAAIAVVLLMIFLSFFEVGRLPRSVRTGRDWARGRAAAGVAGPTKSLTAAGPPWASIPAMISGRAHFAAGTSDDFPTPAQSQPVRRRSAELRPDRSACTRRS